MSMTYDQPLVKGAVFVIRRARRHAALAASLAFLVLSVPAYGQQQPQPRPLYERYTEPIQIYKTGLGSFTRPIS